MIDKYEYNQSEKLNQSFNPLKIITVANIDSYQFKTLSNNKSDWSWARDSKIK